MEARKEQIASIFNGHKTLVVPFYQRSYVWQEDQWRRFLEDMEFISATGQDYFLGSVILKQQTNQNGNNNDTRTIIDGQQRFTTIALFFKVLCQRTNDMDTFRQHFTVRNKKEGNRSIALIHSINDKEDFEKVIKYDGDMPLEGSDKSNILGAYNFFLNNVDVDKVDIDTLLAHIILIGIDLQESDDEQVIFDTINSLGVRLTTGELLKNYFFDENSKEEFENLWMPTFEKDRDVSNYWDSQITLGRTNKSNIDVFLNAFLNIKIEDPSLKVDFAHKQKYRRVDGIFGNYKDLISTYNIDKMDCVWDIVQYAELYYNNIFPDIEKTEIPGEPGIERINFIISTFDCSTLIPYTLYILKNVNEEDERNDIFGYLESYIMRRMICKSNNNSFSDLFSENLIGRGIKDLNSLKEYIENKGTEQDLSFPSNKKLRKGILGNEFQNKRAAAILYMIETGLRADKKERAQICSFDGFAIEHILPKKWNANWPMSEMYDEETRRSLIKTLGNLTILPSKMKPSVSYAEWETKKRGTARMHGLKYLSQGLETIEPFINRNIWDEDAILDRAEKLYKMAAQIWPSMATNEEYEPDDDDSIDDFYTSGGIVAEPPAKESDEKPERKSNQDRTKYSLDGSEPLSKSEFVLYVVKKYMQSHPNATFRQLKEVFNDNMCGSGFKFRGFLCSERTYRQWENSRKETRYRPNAPGRKLKSQDGVVFYVNTQWTLDSIQSVLSFVKKQGWTYKEFGNSAEKNSLTLDFKDEENDATEFIPITEIRKTKFSLDGSEYMNMRDFVFTLVKNYVIKHPKATYRELKSIFNNNLCSRYKYKGFICTIEEFNYWDNDMKETRYCVGRPYHKLKSSDGIEFLVNSQWTYDGFEKITDLAKKLGGVVRKKRV